MTLGGVDVPKAQRPVLERVRGEYPVLALDRGPDLRREPRRGQRRRVPVGLRVALPLFPKRAMRGSDLLAPRGATVVAAAALADQGAQGGEREPRVGDDRERHRLEVAEILGPPALPQLREPDVDDRRAGGDARAFRTVGAVAVQLAQRAVQVADVERDDQVGVLERLAAREVERMPIRDVHAAVQVDDRGGDLLREADELRDRLRMSSGELGDDDRPLGARDELGDLRERRRIGLHRARARPADHIVDRDGVIQRVLLKTGVVAQVDGAGGLRRRDAVRPRE